MGNLAPATEQTDAPVREMGTPPWVRPVLATGVLVAAVAVVLRVATAPLSNPDTWFHLDLGRGFLATGWPLANPPSPTVFGTSQWVPTQWTSQVLMAWAESAWGISGVAWLFGVLYLALICVVYVSCREQAGSLEASVVLVAAVFAMGSNLSARPQVFSLIFMSIVVGAWLRTCQDLKPRWWLVPLGWVWATAHGFWSLGIVVGVVVCVALLLEGRLRGRQALALGAVPVLMLAAACLTPVGPNLVTSQFAVSERSGLITEWSATDFTQMGPAVVAAMVGLTILLWCRRGIVQWPSVLLLGLGVVMAMSAVRLVPVAAVIAAPLLAAELQRWAPAVASRMSRVEAMSLAGLTTAAVAVLTILVPTTASAPEGVPTGLAAELDQLRPGTTVFVEGQVGSWIGWRHPELEPTVDGMFDAYSVQYLTSYQSAVQLEPGWRRFVGGTDAEVAIVRRGSALGAALAEEPGWRSVALSREWQLLRSS